MKDQLANSGAKLKAELELQKSKSTNTDLEEPKTALDTLMFCDLFYPSFQVLLQIFATITIPITTATAE